MIHHLNFLAGLEREIANALFAAGKMTPAGFRQALQQMLEPSVYARWSQCLEGAKGRSWKSLENAARELHFSAGVHFHGDRKQIRLAEESANAIFGLIPLIAGPRQRGKAACEGEWDTLDFCNLCWRLAPAGKATLYRPALCTRHQPRSPGYQQARRLKYDLKNSETNPTSSSKKTIRHFMVRQEFTDTFVELRKKLAPARCFEEFVVELPHIRAAFPERLQNPVLLLQALLLDVPDPYGKIAEAIPGLAVDRDWLVGTLLHAEAWLTLQTRHKHGGSRGRCGDTPETDSPE